MARRQRFQAKTQQYLLACTILAREYSPHHEPQAPHRCFGGGYDSHAWHLRVCDQSGVCIYKLVLRIARCSLVPTLTLTRPHSDVVCRVQPSAAGDRWLVRDGATQIEQNLCAVLYRALVATPASP